MTALSTGKDVAADLTPKVMGCIKARLERQEQPSAADLVRLVEGEIGFAGRWYLLSAVTALLKREKLRHKKSVIKY